MKLLLCPIAALLTSTALLIAADPMTDIRHGNFAPSASAPLELNVLDGELIVLQTARDDRFEIRALWQWVEARLKDSMSAGEKLGSEGTRLPIMSRPAAAQDASHAPKAHSLSARDEINASWDACL